ncbi:hypothetical protein JG687_00017929 [Phytophthora cactorum]|uniref:Uncharacterized protein n=1 Tax=Phytophthora cactorum TaxID=29920 RepID=A0A329SE39_9STRA|nr:hypothetical protein C6341_g13657 [Phytophthora cactorum]KAG6944325.1 hypothetical protein JG687_00017929 [Phytophthora cactorum]RAW35054.1 hypothetical protein PC110_g8661 [Phytophthora cactorum]
MPRCAANLFHLTLSSLLSRSFLSLVLYVCCNLLPHHLPIRLPLFCVAADVPLYSILERVHPINISFLYVCNTLFLYPWHTLPTSLPLYCGIDSDASTS